MKLVDTVRMGWLSTVAKELFTVGKDRYQSTAANTRSAFPARGARLCRAVLTLGVVASSVAACGERSTAPKLPVVTTPTVATVVIEPASVAMMVGQQRSLSAVVRATDGNLLSGRSIVWVSSASTIVSVTPAGNGESATVIAIAPGTATVTASVDSRIAVATISVDPIAPTDFAIVDAQWTQGVQSASGAIPLVLDGNAAVLNVILSSTVTNRAPGQLLLTLTDGSGTVVRTDTVSPPVVAGRASYADPRAQFLVPAAALRAGLRWELRRDPRGVARDASDTNDVFPRASPATLSVASLPAMRVQFVPIILSSHAGTIGDVTLGNTESYLPTLRRAFPLGQLRVSIGTPVTSAATFGAAPNGGNEAFWLQVLADVDLARVADTTSRDAYWIGVVRPPSGFTFTNFGGFSYIPTNPAAVGPGTRTSTVVQTGWFNNQGQTADLVAHELGHAVGRRHAPCGGSSAVDASYPVPGGVIGTVGHDVYSWAIRQTSSAPSRPASTGDLMGYCFPVWASPYTYAGILAARQASVTTALTATAEIKAEWARTRRQHVVVVRGYIDGDRVTLLSAAAIEGIPTDGAIGSYGVELLDGTGEVVAVHRVSASMVDHSLAMTFLAAIPLSVRAAATVTTIRVNAPSGSATRPFR